MVEPAVQEMAPLGGEPRAAMWPGERPATTVGVFGSVPLATAVFVLQAAAWATVHWFGGDGALGWAARVMLSAVVVGVLPGMLMTVLARPRADWTVLELAGVGLAVTFGLVQLLAIFSLVAHVPVRVCVSVLVGWNVIGAAALVIDRRPLRIHMPRFERVLAAALLVVATVLYMKGSPYNSVEDGIHISVVRRLIWLDFPRLDNVYYAPGIVYTYPFPGTHFFMALIGRFSQVDALFVYHKLRAFWGPAAIIYLALAARAVFGAGPAVAASVATALVFVLSGAFSTIPGFFWGQLAPHSHASDVAMGVILPALLVLTFEYFAAATMRSIAFFFGAAMLLVLMLTIVHIREVVQYVAYIGIYGAFLALTSRQHPHLRRVLTLCACIVPFVLLYGVWHNHLVGQVDTLVIESRAKLREVVAAASIRDLLVAQPLPLLNGFYAAYWATFYGWNPLLLLALPLVGIAYARRPLIWLIVASSLVYACVIRFPVFAIPYIYLTYFEILYTPVRNFIFFIHICTGVALFIAAALLARRGRVVGSLLGLAGGSVLALAWENGQNRYLDGHGDVLYLPLIGLLGWAVYEIVRAGSRQDAPYTPPAARTPAGDLQALWLSTAAAGSVWRDIREALAAAWWRSPHPPPRSSDGQSMPIDIAAGARDTRHPWLSVSWLGLGAAVLGFAGLQMIDRVRRDTERPMPGIHVLWAPEVSESRRLALERRFALTDGHRILDNPGQSWGYALADLSERNVRDLVTFPEVRDTADIDRSAFTVLPSAGFSRQTTWAGYRWQWLIDPAQKWGPSALVVLILWSLRRMLLRGALAATKGVRACGAAVTRAVRSIRGVAGQMSAVAAVVSRIPFGRRAAPKPAPVKMAASPPSAADWRSTLRGVVLNPPHGWQMVLAALLVPMAAGSYSTYTSPLGRNAPLVRTPDRLIADMPCIERTDLLAPFQPAGIREPARIEHLLSCPPSPAVARWVEAHVPVSAVIAMNKWNEYAPSWFLPQQFVTWASPTPVLLHEEDVFAVYFTYYHRSLANYGQQPFFNDRESRDERIDFVRDLAVTHILVDPQTHDLMTRVLSGYADLFVRRYDDGRWAVWEVLRK